MKKSESKFLLIGSVFAAVLTIIAVALGVLGKLPIGKKQPIRRTFRNNDTLYRGR
jgi:energy-converting hydrogenase Eha subunit A